MPYAVGSAGAGRCGGWHSGYFVGDDRDVLDALAGASAGQPALRRSWPRSVGGTTSRACRQAGFSAGRGVAWRPIRCTTGKVARLTSGKIVVMSAPEFTASDSRRYTISQDRLGAGGGGEVFRALRDDGETVAVKRVAGGAGRGPDNNRELAIALKLGSQPTGHLLAPLAWAVEGDDLLLVMPLADRSLAHAVAGAPDGLAAEEQMVVLRDTTSGLAELYAAGIVHRDVKPGNVLFRDGRWCVADFGVSRDLDVTTGTVTFQGAGTAPYAAPERWRGEPATHKSDLYALGCIAYEVCTGRRLFTGTSEEVRDQHLHAPVPALPVPAPLARWILRLLDKDPSRRYQHAPAALEALPAQPAARGGLAEAALRVQQRRHDQAVVEAHLTSLAVERASGRRQALADLAEMCAVAADEAREQIPDLVVYHDGHGHRFEIDDLRLVLTLWMREPPLAPNERLVLAGEALTFVHGSRRSVANIVCERDGQQQVWYLDAFVRSPLAGPQEAPAGFAEDMFFTERPLIEAGGLHTWVRQRRQLTYEVILDLIAALLQAAAP